MTLPDNDHLVPLVDGWSVWRWMRLRGSGFPVAMIDQLAMREAARSVDRYLEAQQAELVARDAAVAAYGELYERTARDERKPLVKVLKRLRAGELPAADAPPSDAVERFRLARDHARVCRAELEHAYEAGRRTVARALRDTLGTTRFREAVTWQNRHALHNGLARLVDIPIDAVDKDTRKRELAVASYLQRYCVKNDTISFFGPVAWGTFRDDVSGVALRPGPALLASRTVYYEHWCVNALAQAMAEDAELLPWLKPRRSPTLRIEGTVLHSPIEQRSEVAEPIAALLAACDGERTALAIATELGARTELGFDGEDDVYGYLGALVEQELVSWTLELSPEELYPERYVRAALAEVGDPAARARALEKLDAFESARRNVARAAADPEALDAALAAFEDTFARTTRLAPTRKHGETYGGRTLLYEDCRRDVSFAIGRDILARVGPALALLLTSARWYTYTIARRYRDAITPIYEALRQQTGSDVVDYRRFWSEIRPLLAAEGSSIIDEVTAELHARWRGILDLEHHAGNAQWSSSQLRAPVESAFAAPGPGWPSARYQSPDLMIAARGLDALQRGEFLVVVGEVHTGLNSVCVPVLLKEYPDPAELIRAREADIPMACIAPVWSHERSRADMFSLAAHDYGFENGSTRSWRARDHVISESALFVTEAEGRVVVCTRDGTQQFDIIAFLEQHLMAASHSQFTLLPKAPHLPRVTVDGVVFSRERWQLDCADIAFARLETPLERFVEATRWMRKLCMPRRVFIKVPNETKPMYVDYESSVCVDNMARMLRGADTVTISEMLPGVEDAWLVDGQSNLYTSELRVAALDPVSFQSQR